MSRLGDTVQKIRSKNAGPFWLTIDIFCGTPEVFEQVSAGLDTQQVAARFNVDAAVLKRFDIAALNTIKFSLPRPEVQGVRQDRDMHGASFALVLAGLEI